MEEQGYNQKTMEKFGGFPFEKNIDEGLNVVPDNGLPSGVDPNDFGPEMPKGNKMDDYSKQKAKIEARKAQIEANKKPVVPEVDLYTRGKQLDKRINIIANRMFDEGLPVLVGEIGTEGSKDYRFVGGRIDMQKYVDAPGISRKNVKDDMAEVKSLIEERQEEIERGAKINARQDAQPNALDFQERTRQAEELSFLLLSKAMKGGALLFRSSEYDNLVSGAQMFCLDGKGNPLAAINAVLDDGSRRLAIRNQQRRALDANTGMGIEIKYGLAADVDKKEKNTEIAKDTIFMPLFNIVFNGTELNVLGNLFDSDKELTIPEKRKIDFIIADFYLQIDDLQDRTKKDWVEEKIKAFEIELGKIRSREDVDLIYQELKKERESQRELAESVKPKRSKNPWQHKKKPLTS